MLLKLMQLDLKLSNLALKILDCVVVLLLVLSRGGVHSVQQLLNANLKLLLVPSEALGKSLLQVDLGVLAGVGVSHSLVLRFLLAA